MSDLRQIARLAKTFGGLLPGIDVAGARPGAAGPGRRGARLRARGGGAGAPSPRRSPATTRASSCPGRGRHSQRALVTEWMDSRGLAGQGDRRTAPRRSATTAASSTPGSCSRGRRAPACCTPTRTRATSGWSPADDGTERLGVLDYGAVARLPGRQLPRSLGRLMRIALLDDYDEVVRHLRDEGFIEPNIRVRAEDLRAYLGPFVDPAREETFRFSRDFMREPAAAAPGPLAAPRCSWRSGSTCRRSTSSSTGPGSAASACCASSRPRCRSARSSSELDARGSRDPL